MGYQDTTAKLADYRGQIAELRKKMRALQQAIEPEETKDYEFATKDGPVRLSALFGDKDHLFVIHNMGASCSYCTLWADGFNGLLPHIESRAAFVVSSPDDPATQEKFAAGRGWRFRMVSHGGTGFAEDMGYRSPERWLPGVSVFERRDGRILRVSDTDFGPGDDFNPVWHLLDLLPAGADGWRPRFTYA